MALKKLCRCGKVIEHRERYCSNCIELHSQEKVEANKYYDKYKRDSRVAAFYNSKDWEKTREYILRNYKGLDLYSFFIENKIEYAETVHHIVELKESWNRRLDIKNLFPLTNSNHNKIHGIYKRNKKPTQKMLFDLLDRWNKEFG